MSASEVVWGVHKTGEIAAHRLSQLAPILAARLSAGLHEVHRRFTKLTGEAAVLSGWHD